MKDILTVFTQLDIDRSLLLDAEELRTLVQTSNIELSTEVLEQILSVFDQNNDGTLSYAEFLTMMEEEQEQRIVLDENVETVDAELKALQKSWETD